LAYARAWFWITDLKTAEDKLWSEKCAARIEELFPDQSPIRDLAVECYEWRWGAEHLALLRYYFGEYGQQEEKQAGQICGIDHRSRASVVALFELPLAAHSEIGGKRGQGQKILKSGSFTEIIFLSSTRARIRRWIERRNGLVFDESWASLDSEDETGEVAQDRRLDSSQIRLRILSMIRGFFNALESNLVPTLPIDAWREETVIVILDQECRRSE